MESLPRELLVKIIGCLPLRSIVKCRLVSKRWRTSIDSNLRINDLVISDRVIDGLDWSFVDEPVDCRNLIKQINISHPSFVPPIIKNVQKLFINTSQRINLTILLQCLQELRQLDIYKLKSSNARLTIDLPHLTHLNIGLKKFLIDLNAPNLSHVKHKKFISFKENELKFRHPASVRHLEIESCSDTKVASFINLEYLECEIDDLCEENCLDLMKNLASLRELHLHFEFDYLDSLDVDFSLTIPQLKRELGRDLKIYLVGVNVTGSSESFAGILSFSSHKEMNKWILKNYDENNLANRITSDLQLDYPTIRDHFAGTIPSEFLSRFVNIHYMFIDGQEIDDELKLIEYLKHFRKVRRIRIDNSASLDQRFFDKLPGLLPQIQSLCIYGTGMLNQEFILKMKSLRSLETDHVMKYELINKLVMNNRNLEHLVIEYAHPKDAGKFIKMCIACGKSEYMYKTGCQSEPKSFQSRRLMLEEFKKDLVREEEANDVEDADLNDER